MPIQATEYHKHVAGDLRLWVARGTRTLERLPGNGSSAGVGVPVNVSVGPPPTAPDFSGELSPNGREVETFGAELGRWLLADPLDTVLRDTLNDTPPDAVTRLRLAFPDNETSTEPLTHLPWELASVPGLGFLALHPQLRLVRETLRGSGQSDNPANGDMLKTDSGRGDLLRVLLVGANPATDRYGYLAHLGPELEAARAALEGSPECRRTIRVLTLPRAAPEAMRDALRDFRPHILHLVCHAEPLPSGAAFLLCDSRQANRAAPVYYEELASWAGDCPLRLTLIGACGFPSAPSHLAALFNRSRPTDVVAMQRPLRDGAALPFARAFYSAFAEGTGVEESLWQARQAVRGMGLDWATPCLYRATAVLDADRNPVLVPTPPKGRRRKADSPTPLPSVERAFIGRVGPVADVLGLFRRDGARLVTVTGIGGMGKTTLARQCARLLKGDHPGGVYWLEADTLSGPDEILCALCAATGAPEQDLAPRDRLRRFLARRRVLVVLDCFEQHVAHAPLVEDLVRNAPGLRLLVTSRVVLGVQDEYEYPLAPMLLPPTDGAMEGEARMATVAESVALFADVAARARHGFRVDTGNRAVVEEICRHLDGLPLALVLAAGRLRYLTPEELREQLRLRYFDVVRQPRPASERHNALQRVIADSFELLEPSERALLRQLVVFAGGFHLDDALAVCDLSDEEDGDVFDGVGRLREHSLLQSEARDGRTRFYLLDAVREYLRGVGAPDDATRKRHRDHFLVRARALYTRTKANDWVGLSADLTADLTNLRAAIRDATESGDNRATVEFADLLSRLLIQAGFWSDFDALADAAQRAHGRITDSERFIRLVAFRAMIARSRGAETEARLLIERWLAFCRERGDGPGATDALLELASQARTLGEEERTETLLADALAVAQSVGDDALILRALVQRADLYAGRGDRDAARTAASAATDRLPYCSSLEARVACRITLGRVYRTLGETDRAERELHEALRSAVDGAETFAVSRALLELAPLYEACGALSRAARAYHAADAVHQKLNARRREESARLLRRFRRAHGSEPAVHAAIEESNTEPWVETIARLLADPLAGEGSDD